jgi:hypothetical protein
VSVQFSYEKLFTVLPKVGVVVTNMTYSGFKTGSKIFGWMANISDITMTGATLTLIP